MRISIDNRQTDCLYVDKANLHTADATEIIKFIIKDDIADKVDLYLNFIAIVNELNVTETILLKYLFNKKNERGITNPIVIKDVRQYHAVSYATIVRGLNVLNTKHLITYNDKGEIKINSSINNTFYNIRHAKFYVIELKDNNNAITI